MKRQRLLSLDRNLSLWRGIFLQELQPPSTEQDLHLSKHVVQNNLQYLKAFSNLVITDFSPPDKN